MKYAVVDYRIDNEELDSLNNLGYSIFKCPPYKNLYEAVMGHPDMLLHIIDHHNIIVHKDMCSDSINFFEKLNYTVIKSNSSLSSEYPLDIILNAVNLDNFFIHKIKNTDSKLINLIKSKKIINVKQGYTKCSTAIVSNNAIITSDPSIVKALKNRNIDILIVPPGDIILPGLDYGFIGGTCGLLDNKHLAFYGNLNHYKYRDDVLKFLEKHNVEPIYLRNGKLIDRGSIFVVES